MNRCTSPVALLIAAGLTATPSSAQPYLDPAGGTVNFSGTFEDFLVPDLRGTVFLFTVHGADGGDSRNTNNSNNICFKAGGQGATAQMDVLIDVRGPAFRADDKLRFIVGGEGETGIDPDRLGGRGGGGGGGSALLYSPGSLNDFFPVIVAGGGGGAFAERDLFGCEAPGDGAPGQVTEAGSNGLGETSDTNGQGGVNGQGGNALVSSGGLDGGAGGGGWLTSGVDFDGNPTLYGGQAGLDTGGAGGVFETGRSGGFGFGGGGAAFGGDGDGTIGGGGGGGGFSGGGGGANAGGGGGGSFLQTTFALAASITNIVEGAPGANGSIVYEVIRQSHDSFAAPLPIVVNNQGLGVINGSALAALPTALIGDTQPLLPDVWYIYTNDSPDTALFQLDWDSAEVHEVTLVREVPTPISFDSDGDASANIDPGDSLLVRVESNADSFSIGVIVDVDSDSDGIVDALDMCPGFDDTLDTDGDMVPDDCDRCEGFDDLADADGDLVPDACDVCPDGDDVTDSDGDGVADGCDICPGFNDNADRDGDSIPNACDACPGFDDFADADGDGIPNGCEDTDGDGVTDPFDVCPGFDDNADADGNGIMDCLEDCDGDGIPNGIDEPFSAVLTDVSLGPIGDETQTVSFSTCIGSNVETILGVWTQDGTLIASLGENAPGCAPAENSLSLQLAAGSYFVGAYGGSAILGETGFEASYDPERCPTSGVVQITILDGNDIETTRGGTLLARELLRIPFEIVEAASPCPADVNNDGELDGADFNSWLDAFSAGDPAADQNDDGNLDGADFNAWLANFAAGCDG